MGPVETDLEKGWCYVPEWFMVPEMGSHDPKGSAVQCCARAVVLAWVNAMKPAAHCVDTDCSTDRLYSDYGAQAGSCFDAVPGGCVAAPEECVRLCAKCGTAAA